MVKIMNPDYCAIPVEGRKKNKGSLKMDDLPILVTCRSGTLAMLSSKVNGPVALSRSTRAPELGGPQG